MTAQDLETELVENAENRKKNQEQTEPNGDTISSVQNWRMQHLDIAK